MSDAHHPHEEGLPRLFGRYRLLSLLGQGGMAAVYLAELSGPEGFSRKVALKRVHAHLGTRTSFRQLFLREARLGGLLHHPNILQTLDYGLVEGQPYLALELVEGVSLEAVLSQQRLLGEPLPDGALLSLGLQLCRGLAYAHTLRDEQGQPLQLVHRDIKPSNVLLSRFGEARLADFGIARADIGLDITQESGVIKGTALYMSPEQALGEPSLDHRSDLFALGLLLFELYTLQPFYEPTSPLVALQRAQSPDVEARLVRLPPGPLTDELREVLRGLLARSPEQRWPHAQAVAQQLLRLERRLQEPFDFAGWSEQVVQACRGQAGAPSVEATSHARLEATFPSEDLESRSLPTVSPEGDETGELLQLPAGRAVSTATWTPSTSDALRRAPPASFDEDFDPRSSTASYPAQRLETRQSMTEPTRKSVTELSSQSVTEPTRKPMTEPSSQSMTEPTRKPMSELSSQSVTEPTRKSVTELSSQSVTEPTRKPMTELSSQLHGPKVLESEGGPTTPAALEEKEGKWLAPSEEGFSAPVATAHVYQASSRHVLLRAIMGLTLGLLLLLLVRVSGLLTPLDTLRQDFYAWSLLPPASTHKVLIVDLSDEVEPWPWKRSTHARLLERLVQEGQVAQVVLDVVLSARSAEPQEAREAAERRLAALQAETGKLVIGLGGFLQAETTGAEPMYRLSSDEPFPELLQGVPRGFAALLAPGKRGGPVRRAALYAEPLATGGPPLELSLVARAVAGAQPPQPDRQHRRLKLGEHWISTDGLFAVELPPTRPESFPTVSAARLLEVGPLPPALVEQLRGRHVVLGRFSDPYLDRVATPWGYRPGVVVQATLLAELLEGKSRHRGGLGLELGVLVVLGGWGMWSWQRREQRARVSGLMRLWGVAWGLELVLIRGLGMWLGAPVVELGVLLGLTWLRPRRPQP